MNITELQCRACYAPLDSTGQHSKVVVCDFCGTENVLSDDIRIVTASCSRQFQRKLVNAIAFSFSSLDEIKYLINVLDGELDYYSVDFDNLCGSTVTMKSLELVQWCYRRELLQQLVDVCLSLRPRMEI